MKNKRWHLLSQKTFSSPDELLKEVVEILLNNRGIIGKKDIKNFFQSPDLGNIRPQDLGISLPHLKKAIQIIKKAIADQKEIIIYGDFDVDGICSTAILWETLNKQGARVFPYIPHRTEEGYGLSQKGIDNIIQKQGTKNLLIITVDNGISAVKEIEYANKQGIDVIIVDHHQKGKKLPASLAVLWTDKLCAAGLAWFLSQELGNDEPSHLELAAIATVADLQSLTGFNRQLVKIGLEKLNQTRRIGLTALIRESRLEIGKIDCYSISHIISPRLNAAGRLENALDALRLLCTRDIQRASDLSLQICQINNTRQKLTIDSFEQAKNLSRQVSKQKIIILSHKDFQQGIIGLIASKLVDEHSCPVIVISEGEEFSKGSARSVEGINIIKVIKSVQDILMDIGGHPMAAGFTIQTQKIEIFKKRLQDLAEQEFNEEKLSPILKIDCQIDLNYIRQDLFEILQKFAPFGNGNPQPVFLSRDVFIEDLRTVGSDSKHLKLTLSSPASQSLYPSFPAIAFGFGELAQKLKIRDKIDIIYTIEEDSWNGSKKLQLKIKDLKPS